MARPTEVPGLTGRTPLSVAGPLLVRARLADVRLYEERFEGQDEPDGDVVHDMRVASRRLRAAIALFGGPALTSLEPEVKALQDALGRLRDLQVQRGWMGRSAERARPGHGTRLAAWVDRDRPAAEKKVRRFVRAWRAAVAEQLEAAAPAAARRGRLGGATIVDRVDEHLARLSRRLEQARRKASPRRLHRLRIATKKVRYVVELVRPAFQEEADEVLAALVPLQEQLGDVHDTHVRAERLASLRDDGTAAERKAAAAALEIVEADRTRQESALQHLLGRWHEEQVLKGLRKLFR